MNVPSKFFVIVAICAGVSGASAGPCVAGSVPATSVSAA
jgi:hypothetical protein